MIYLVSSLSITQVYAQTRRGVLLIMAKAVRADHESAVLCFHLQTIITDCSFVSSLVIAAAYERRHGLSLLSSSLASQRPSRPACPAPVQQ